MLEKTPHTIRVWTAAEKEKVKDMFYEGYSDDDIGKKLGRSAKAVAVQRHYLRLLLNKQPAKEFVIHDAMADYYPRWYKRYLKEKWLQNQ